MFIVILFKLIFQHQFNTAQKCAWDLELVLILTLDASKFWDYIANKIAKVCSIIIT